MDATALPQARRLSITKIPIQPVQPFERLPDEIIEQILRATDPNAFASLIILNRKWRAVSQRSHLYLQHLARCPSYLASPGGLPSADDKNLPRLRRLFAKEIKRNLFDAYVRPNETVIKLVSNSISSSSHPGGEGFGFAASPRGHHILAFNSSRIYVIDVREASVQVKRELKILRRPASACITDDAARLAVLSTEMQVDIYDLTQKPPKRKQSLILDNNPRTIAISTCGTVLAAAYDGGIEVQSLNPGALPTERRAVKCDAVDALAFSFDGTQILGTTLHSPQPSTVVITAPYYDPGAQMLDENLSAMWTTSILFPNSSRDCSHAVLLQDGSQEEALWAFAYDRSFETFRAVRIDDLRNGTTYFTGPMPKTTSPAPLLPCTLPSATYRGELVSAGFQRNEVWVYGVPEDLAALPEATSTASEGTPSGVARRNSAQGNSSRPPSTRTQDAASATTGRVPQWQILCDKLRNNFVAGHKVSDVIEVSNVKWVSGFSDSSFQERLVITARGITAPRLITDEEDMDFVDGGRITLVDFDYAATDGLKTEITIEVGTDQAEILEEERRDIETEVAIVRRRTVAQRRGGRGGGGQALLRAATTTAQNLVDQETSQENTADDDPLVPRTIGAIPTGRPARPTIRESTTNDEDVLTIEEQEALDQPYAHSSPRSGTTLRRAATAAAVNRRLNPRTADGRPIEYRRADGRREHPHESDADNWVPPPPPYQKEDPGDAPAFLRGPAVLAPLSIPGALLPPLSEQSYQHQAQSGGTSLSNASVTHSATAALGERPHDLDEKHGAFHRHRSASDSTTASRIRTEISNLLTNAPDPAEREDIYDASPPSSPRQSRAHVVSIPRRAVPNNGTLEPTSAVSANSNSMHESSSVTSTRMSTEIPITMPRLGPQISTISNPERRSDASPHVRRLSNAQTWPLAPRAEGTTASASITEAGILTSATLLPAPSTDQIERLQRRISQGNPHHLSGSLTTYGLHSRQQFGDGTIMDIQQPTPVSTISSSSITEHDVDQPLIISTPGGVAGAYDPPERRTSQRGDTPILAPVPRRPRPTTTSVTRPTVERLETIYSVGGNQATQTNTLVLPAWMRGPSTSPGRSGSTVNRKPSRAERSAAKNMRDARQRGWRGKAGKASKNKKEEDTQSTGWTDVPSASASKEHEKEKKCVVM